MPRVTTDLLDLLMNVLVFDCC